MASRRALTAETFLAALAVLGVACDKKAAPAASSVTAEPPRPEPAASAAPTPPPPPKVQPSAASSASCGAGGCSPDMKKGTKH